MDKQSTLGLLTFAQNERFHLIKRVRKNLNWQLVFIFLGISIIAGYEGIVQIILSKLFGDKTSYDTITPIVPIVLFIQFIAFGYLIALYTQNSKVLKQLMQKLVSDPDVTLQEDEKKSIMNMARSYSFVEPFADQGVFEGSGKTLNLLYKLLISIFVFVNHVIVYKFVELIVGSSVFQKVLFAVLFVINLLFYNHFYSANKEMSHIRTISILLVVLEIIIFIFFLLSF